MIAPTNMKLHPKSLAILQTLRSDEGAGKRTVFVSGTFNIVHPGHLRLLRFAAECGERLVVGVLDDRLSEWAQLSQDMRLEGVAAISWVDHAFLLHDAPEDFIAELRPAVVVKGKEFETRSNPELAIVESCRTEVETLLGDPTKAKEKLGWTPKTTFDELVAEMVREDLKSAERDELIEHHGYRAMHYHE